jgi:hypothetical protein
MVFRTHGQTNPHGKTIKRCLKPCAAGIMLCFTAIVGFLVYKFLTTEPYHWTIDDAVHFVMSVERSILGSVDHECDQCSGSVNSHHSSLDSWVSIGKNFTSGNKLSDGSVNGTSAFVMLNQMQSAGVRFESLGQYARGIRFQSYLNATPLKRITPVANFMGSLAVPLYHHGLYFGFRSGKAKETKTYMWFDLKSSGIHWNVSHVAPASEADSWSDAADLEPIWVAEFLELHQDRSWQSRSWNCQHFAYEFKKYIVNRCNQGLNHTETCPTMDFHSTMPSYYNVIASCSWTIPFVMAGFIVMSTALYLRTQICVRTSDPSDSIVQPLLPQSM